MRRSSDSLVYQYHLRSNDSLSQFIPHPEEEENVKLSLKNAKRSYHYYNNMQHKPIKSKLNHQHHQTQYRDRGRWWRDARIYVHFNPSKALVLSTTRDSKQSFNRKTVPLTNRSSISPRSRQLPHIIPDQSIHGGVWRTDDDSFNSQQSLVIKGWSN
jgi:hypothetical protein